MSKRFTDTEIWNEDWFLSLSPKYMLLFMYIKDDCDHAGVWRPRKRFVEMITNETIDLDEAFALFNNDKERVQRLENGRWFLPDFFVFQYGHNFNTNNRVHKSISEILSKNNLSLGSIRGLKDLTEGVKDKDKDKDKDSSKKNKETKHRYGQYQNILLSDRELERLKKEFNHNDVDMAIEYLSEYKAEKDYKTKSDNITLRRWVFDAIKKNGRNKRAAPTGPEKFYKTDTFAGLCKKCGEGQKWRHKSQYGNIIIRCDNCGKEGKS